MEPHQSIPRDSPPAPKKDPLSDWRDPKKTGITAIMMAAASFFIFGTGFSLMAGLLGSFGVYNAMRRKMGVKLIMLNVLAIVLAFTSSTALSIMTDPRMILPQVPISSIAAPMPTPDSIPIRKTPAHVVPSDQVVQIEALMAKNGKSLEGLQAHDFRRDEEDIIHVDFSVYVHGVYAGETIYHFGNDGVISSIPHDFDTNRYENISVVPRITPTQAIAIAGNRIKQGPLVAVQIFWNKNNMDTMSAKDIVLAWKVQSPNNSFPYIIIDAQTGAVMYYDDGVRY